jgi:hypothetical protein
MALLYTQTMNYSVPRVPREEYFHAANFQEFDGLTTPRTSNLGGIPEGTAYGANPRPGQQNTPLNEQTYTPGPLRGVVGTLGGQPLPVANPLYRLGRGYTAANDTQRIQTRMGAGTNSQGVAQTVQLSEITNNPPVPGDISAILAGLA